MRVIMALLVLQRHVTGVADDLDTGLELVLLVAVLLPPPPM